MPITQLNAQELQDRLAAEPDCQVIDVRTPEEYLYLGHIASAHLLPLHELPYRFQDQIDPNKDSIIVCQHGVRSMDACAFLQAKGYERLFNLDYGMASWDGPIERDTL